MITGPGPQPELEDVPIYATPEGCSPPPGPTTLLLQPPTIVMIEEEGEEEGAEQREGLEEEVDHEIAASGNVCCCLLVLLQCPNLIHTPTHSSIHPLHHMIHGNQNPIAYYPTQPQIHAPPTVTTGGAYLYHKVHLPPNLSSVILYSTIEVIACAITSKMILSIAVGRIGL